MLKLTTIALSSMVLALGLAACGGSSSSSSSTTSSAASAPATSASSSTSTPASTSTTVSTGASGALAIAANPSGLLKYTKSTLSAKAGKVTIAFANSSPLAHNFTLQEGTNGKILGATPTFQGGVKTLTLNLKPGTYTYFCTVPGHRMAGMVGTLTVS
jgi:plastocyanin